MTGSNAATYLGDACTAVVFLAVLVVALVWASRCERHARAREQDALRTRGGAWLQGLARRS